MEKQIVVLSVREQTQADVKTPKMHLPRRLNLPTTICYSNEATELENAREARNLQSYRNR